jgi:hypothetical protein
MSPGKFYGSISDLGGIAIKKHSAISRQPEHIIVFIRKLIAE